ncbi:hypothetical protein Tco_0833638 [Tanacetum coccineum]
MKLEKALIDFDSHQAKRLSSLKTQLGQQQDDMIKQNRNPSSPKRVHFVNSIVLLNKEDEAREEGNMKSNTTKYKDHEMTVESEDEFEEETEEEIKEEEEDNPEHFETFPTVKELRLHYNWIMSKRLEPRRKPSNPKKICNFIGRVKGLKVFVGNFTYKCDFVVLEDTTSVIDHDLGNYEERGIEWLDVKEPLDLVDTGEESVYETLIKEMPKCSLNYDFRIKNGDPRNLKIPCMIGHKFTANTYIDVDLPMNVMSLTFYNSIRKSGYKYKGRNFVRLGRDMHVFVGNTSYVMDFNILENIETNINPSLSHITFKTPYKNPERSELSSEGQDLLSSRIILSEDDYDKGYRKPSDLEDGFYRDTIKLRPEYVTRIADEGEVT